MKANQEVYLGFPAYHIKALNDLAVSLQLVCVCVWGGGWSRGGQGQRLRAHTCFTAPCSSHRLASCRDVCSSTDTCCRSLVHRTWISVSLLVTDCNVDTLCTCHIS